ncbi:MAG: hypothetical protein GY859_23720, partial [Desulfobacterales bacterium]|nr:hypothetical protein [Desulfobacterales bacterium]
MKEVDELGSTLEETTRALEEEKTRIIGEKVAELEAERLEWSGEIAGQEEKINALLKEVEDLGLALEETTRTLEEEKTRILNEKEEELEAARAQIEKLAQNARDEKTLYRFQVPEEPETCNLVYVGDFGAFLEAGRLGDAARATPWPENAEPGSPDAGDIDLFMIDGAMVPKYADRLLAYDKPVLVVSNKMRERKRAFKALPHMALGWMTTGEIKDPRLLESDLKILASVGRNTLFKDKENRLISLDRIIKKHLEKILEVCGSPEY